MSDPTFDIQFLLPDWKAMLVTRRCLTILLILSLAQIGWAAPARQLSESDCERHFIHSSMHPAVHSDAPAMQQHHSEAVPHLMSQHAELQGKANAEQTLQHDCCEPSSTAECSHQQCHSVGISALGLLSVMPMVSVTQHSAPAFAMLAEPRLPYQLHPERPPRFQS